MLLTLCWVCSNFWTAVERCFMPPRSEFTCTHQIKPTLTLRSYAQHVFFHPPKNTPTLTLRVAPIYPPNKNANISPWELCIQLHSLHSLLWGSLPLFFRQQQRNGLFKKMYIYMRKAKRQTGKSIPIEKKFIAHYLLSSSYHSNKRESFCKEWPRIFRIRTSTKNSTHMHILI